MPTTSTRSSSRASPPCAASQELTEAFDDPSSQAGAQEMLASIDRMLEVLAARG